jgi:hypothetical protein
MRRLWSRESGGRAILRRLRLAPLRDLRGLRRGDHGRKAILHVLLAEAREIFEDLGAAPWLERVERLTAAPDYAAASAGEA